jgi:hypothetical protein
MIFLTNLRRNQSPVLIRRRRDRTANPNEATTHAHDQRPMPADQHGEGGVIAAVGEGVEQLFVALVAVTLGGDHAAKLANSGGPCGMAHDCDSESGRCCSLLIVPAHHGFVDEIVRPLPSESLDGAALVRAADHAS